MLFSFLGKLRLENEWANLTLLKVYSILDAAVIFRGSFLLDIIICFLALYVAIFTGIPITNSNYKLSILHCSLHCESKSFLFYLYQHC